MKVNLYHLGKKIDTIDVPLNFNTKNLRQYRHKGVVYNMVKIIEMSKYINIHMVLQSNRSQIENKYWSK